MQKETEGKNTETNDEINNNTHVPPDSNSKPVNFYYEESYREKTHTDSDMPSDLVQFNNIIGQDANRRYNFFFLNDQEIITANANTFQVINLNTKQRRIFQGTETGGIGCVTVHPEKKFFAVGECGEWPNIYIYEYDKNELITESGHNKLKLYRILRKGTERTYSALSFNQTGDKIASVGSDPDYNMLIWNWMNESIILKAKAFSQEIFNVQFSQNFEGKLISSGIGHIKFWEMAKTFTGLKLQGELGKFGQIDLSDISAFLEFQDGKVLCGTENGTFLLWEGIFIKAHIMVNEESTCHNGLIEYMAWENNNESIVTGGHDGYLKWWSFQEIDNISVDDNSLGFVQPSKQKLLINPISNLPVKIINLVKEKDFCLVQDGNGGLLKILNLNSTDEEIRIESIYEFHSGPVIKLCLMSPSPYLVTQGSDATASLVNMQDLVKNFTDKQQIENQSADLVATACDFGTRESNEDSLVLAIGYSIGLFRIYQFDNNSKKLELVNQLRAHEEAVSKILISPDKSYILTATTREIFIFLLHELDNVLPHCCIKRSEDEQQEQIVDIDWHLDSQRILVGLNTGNVEEIEIPKTFDSHKSYLMTEYECRIFTVKLADNQMEKEDEIKKRRKKDQKTFQEPGPSPILSCKYANLYQEGDFLLTANKPYNDSLYLCNFEHGTNNPKMRPINCWKLPRTNTVKEFYVKHISKNFIFLANNRGSIQIRNKKLIDKYIEIFPNLYSSLVWDVTLSNDERTLAISYKDGTVFVYNINIEGISTYLQFCSLPDAETQISSMNFKDIILPNYDNMDKFLSGIKKNNIQIESEKLRKKRADLETMISLEKEKKYEQEREKLEQAEERKNKSRQKIQKLREEFEKAINGNNALHEEIRLNSDELIVDEQYLDIIKKDRDVNLADIKQKYDWLKANVDYTIDKITTFFLDSVKTPKIFVYSLKSTEYVTTLRCPNLPSNYFDEIIRMGHEIEEFEAKIDFKSLAERYEKFVTNNESNKEKEDENVRSMAEKVRTRMVDYSNSERENHSSGKRAESNKNAIKEELEYTNYDLKDLKKILDDKKGIKEKILRKYVENREKGKKRGTVKNANNYNFKVLRCPDSYSLKINYDSYYNEERMRTVLLHKKKMFDFLKLLFDNREEFNKSVLDLRRKKEELIAQLQEKKNQLKDINLELGIEPEKENLDWLDFKMNEALEYPERDFKIHKEELDKYVHDKVLHDKELSITFNVTPQTKSNTTNSNLLNINDKEGEFSFLFNIKERRRSPNETHTDSELRSINQIKLEHKKKILLEQCTLLIEEFDKQLKELKKVKTETSYKQKLGEFEMLIKHEEYSILRAFESDDIMLIRKLEDLYNDYQDNLRSLNNCHDEIEQKEEELKRSKEDRKAKENEFLLLIQNEKDSRDQLIKCFNQKRKLDLGNNLVDDKMDNEEELDLPRNISNQLKQDILSLRDSRMHFDETIDKLVTSINGKKKEKDNLIQAMRNLDKRLDEIRDKINVNERKKARYLNLIEISVPLKMDQFCKLEVNPSQNELGIDIHKLQIDITKAVLISKTKLIELKSLLNEIKCHNDELERNNTEFENKYNFKEREKKELDRQLKELETNFQNEQILKFGLVIDFEHLLKASENTIIDKLEHEYKILKREADRMIDEYKYKIDDMKKDLKYQLNENTILLNRIKEGLERNQTLDKKLNEKNNEIDVRTMIIFFI